MPWLGGWGKPRTLGYINRMMKNGASVSRGGQVTLGLPCLVEGCGGKLEQKAFGHHLSNAG